MIFAADPTSKARSPLAELATASGAIPVALSWTACQSNRPSAPRAKLPLPPSCPVSVAADPNGDRFVAVGAGSQAGSIDIIDLFSNTVTCRVSGVQLPSGVVFDPVNQVFVAANSLQNNIVIVDPLTCIPTTVRVGINPTSVDYNFQTSTLVTVNSASNTMSFLDYMCPPAVGVPVTCTSPQTREIFGLPSSAKFSQNQQFSVAIDAKLNLAVVVDTNNSRVLLIPLPH